MTACFVPIPASCCPPQKLRLSSLRSSLQQMASPLLGLVQVNEKTKKVCIPDGYAPPLAAFEAEVRSPPQAIVRIGARPRAS